MWFMDGIPSQVVAVFDDDVENDSGAEGFSMWFCDPTDLANDAGGVTYDWISATANLAASAGTPFASLAPGDRLAVVAATTTDDPGTNGVFHEVVSVNNGGADLTLASVSLDLTDTRLRFFRCNERIYRDPSGGIVVEGLRGPDTVSDPCGSRPEGYVFYNDTSDYYCFCNGSGDDVQMHSPTAACF